MADIRPQKKINFAVICAVCGAWYNSIWGYTSRRKRLLGHLWVRQRTLHLGGRSLTALEGGQSGYRTPVLCLHGAAGNAVNWGWLLKHAADHYQIVALDRPGYGPTETVAPRLIDDVKLLEEALAVYAGESKEGQVILLGQSAGSGIASWLAASRPDLIKALVLVDAELDPEAAQPFSCQQLFSKKYLSWFLPRALRQGNYELLQYGSYLAALKPQLNKITCPVTIIHSNSTKLVAPARSAYIKKACTAVKKLNIIPHDSRRHFLTKTKPRRILEVLESL